MTVSNAPKIEPNAKEINMAKNKVAHKLELGNLVTTFKMNTYEYQYVFFCQKFLKRKQPHLRIHEKCQARTLLNNCHDRLTRVMCHVTKNGKYHTAWKHWSNTVGYSDCNCIKLAIAMEMVVRWQSYDATTCRSKWEYDLLGSVNPNFQVQQWAPIGQKVLFDTIVCSGQAKAPSSQDHQDDIGQKRSDVRNTSGGFDTFDQATSDD